MTVLSFARLSVGQSFRDEAETAKAQAAFQAEVVPRGIINEPSMFEAPSFKVRVAVDRDDGDYQQGDTVFVKVTSARRGYVYLFYKTVEKELFLLFPNKVNQENRINSRQTLAIPPDAGAGYKFTIGKPYGKESFIAVVSSEELDFPDPRAQTRLYAKLPDGDLADVLKKASASVAGLKDFSIAEHSKSILTVAEMGPKPVVQRRFALFVGVSESKFAEQRNAKQPMDAFAFDARDLQTTLRFSPEDIVLVGQEATKAKIKKAWYELSEKSRPGDTILIYWSGHGGRLNSTVHGEPDGQDEYLCTYDTDFADANAIRKTALMDNEFEYLLQKLDGRRVGLIIDACHSGGIGAAQPPANRLMNDGLDRGVQELEQIGQRGISLLAACGANEEAFVMQPPQRCSVMTNMLIQQLKINASIPSFSKLHEIVTPNVVQYVNATFGGKNQRPLVLENKSFPFPLKK